VGKQQVVDVMSQLVEHTQSLVSSSVGDERKKNQFRVNQFKKALNSLREFKGEITSGKQAQELPGIGKGIGDRIDEVIKTGTLSELHQVKPIDETTRIINELTTVTGIGEANAKRFIELGVTGLDDLRAKVALGTVKLTNHMAIGLRYYHEILQKIPFAEIVELGAIMTSCVHDLYPEIAVCIAGSHRRQRALSGDIDVLITTQNIMTEEDLIESRVHYLKEIVKALKGIGFIVDDLTTQGDTKYMGVCLHPTVKIGRRIDIRLVTFDSFYPAILYFTGSMELNRKMRTVALQKGLMLNEYGLWRCEATRHDNKIMVNSEKEIFELLGLAYLEPHERDGGQSPP
jgi:DNA polymerase beta